MKIYEYAKKRGVKSKDVVNKLKEMGFSFIKNHLSLVPEMVLDELDEMSFTNNKSVKKVINTQAFITMECSPFIDLSIGDKVKSKIETCKALSKVVIMPKINVNIKIEDIFTITDNSKVYKYINNNIQYYFIENDKYFNRDKLFGYSDDSERIAFFCKTAIELLKKLNYQFDIINIHDWPLGLFPLMFENSLRNEMKECKIEYSVYGVTYQGIYGEDVLNNFDLDIKYFEGKTVEHAMSVNFLKAGLVTANKIDMSKLILSELKKSYLKEYIYDNM